MARTLSAFIWSFGTCLKQDDFVKYLSDFSVASKAGSEQLFNDKPFLFDHNFQSAMDQWKTYPTLKTIKENDRIEEADVDVQTDAFLDRPPSPLFIPQSTGKDICTQIETGDLFDFDLEVKPIVETLVGKTVEQALIEVAEEEELAKIREQQREYEEIRNAELIELQRLEEQERRLRAEKERRMKQAQEALRLEQDAAQKIAARAFAKAYLQDLVPSVFNNLRENGYFYDPVENEIETSFMPWLMNKTMTHVNQLVLGRTILDSIIRDVVNQRIDDYDKLAEALKQTIEGGIDMGTSTGDIVHSSEQNIENLESNHGELNVTMDNNTNEGGEISNGALLNDETDEREEEQTNANEDAGGEQ
ncbi:unnamed protein product [Rotaria magnacalcarata]|uniref:Uncharacterized protein n=1 Tax=Rotaria magnacalcarata TaxID=392030 RepID=A0A8S2S8W6_9BILA|nr:unnamed protein product [Rotaria magnacalcarata]